MDIRIVKFFLEAQKLNRSIRDNKKQRFNFPEITDFDKVNVRNAKQGDKMQDGTHVLVKLSRAVSFIMDILRGCFFIFIPMTYI